MGCECCALCAHWIMASLTELHRETKKLVRRALIEGPVPITEYGTVIATLEADSPREVVSLDVFCQDNFSDQSVNEAIRAAREERQ